MTKKKVVIQALKDGAILSVDWKEIDEMLGLNPEHILMCSLCENSGNFHPKILAEFEATESEINDILRETGVKWIADDFPAGNGVLGHIMTRVFAVKKPNPIRWMNNPYFSGQE